MPIDVEELFHAHAQDVYRYLCYRAGQGAAEDLTQDTFVRACRHQRSYRGDASPRTWLFAIARGVAVDHLRARRRRRSRFAPDGEDWLPTVISVSDDPPGKVLRHELFERIDRALARLQPQDQEVILLRLVAGFKTSESGHILGWSDAKVAKRLHQALRRLRAILAEEEEGGKRDEPERWSARQHRTVDSRIR